MSIDKTVRDICSVSVALASKSAVRRIIEEHDEERDTQIRIDTLKEVEEMLNIEINVLGQFRGDSYHDYAREYIESIRTHLKSLQDKK